jgi:hypothetical protein
MMPVGRGSLARESGAPDERLREEANPPTVNRTFELRKIRLREEAKPPTVSRTFELRKIRLREEAKPPTMIPDV